MKKNRTKTIIFILSLLPWIYFAILGIQNCMKEIKMHGAGYFNPDDFIIPVGNFWTEAIRYPDCNILYILIVLFAIGYPMYYFMTLKDSYFVRTWSYVLYLLSFLVYIPLGTASIIGFNFMMTKLVGFEAVLFVFIFGCAIPIYPTLILFQLIYFFKHRKHFSKIQKLLLGMIVGILVVGIMIPCILH